MKVRFPLLLCVLVCFIFMPLHSLERSESPVSFNVGEMAIDKSRNILYLTDLTSGSIYKINMLTGKVILRKSIASSIPGGFFTGVLDNSASAISNSGKFLYITIPFNSNILTINTSTLVAEKSSHVTAPGPMNSMESIDGSHVCLPIYHSGFPRVGVISLNTGTALSYSDAFIDYPLIRKGVNGTIFAVDVGVSASTLPMRWYSILGGSQMQAKGSCEVQGQVIRDYSVDEVNGNLYVVNYGGLYVTNMSSGAIIQQAIFSPGATVGQDDSFQTYYYGCGSTVFGLSKSNGSIGVQFDTLIGSTVMNKMLTSANGITAYVTDSNQVGLIGASRICLESESVVSTIRCRKTPGTLVYSFESIQCPPGGSQIVDNKWYVNGILVDGAWSMELAAVEGNKYDVALLVSDAVGKQSIGQIELIASVSTAVDVDTSIGAVVNNKITSSVQLDSGGCGSGSLLSSMLLSVMIIVMCRRQN